MTWRLRPAAPRAGATGVAGLATSCAGAAAWRVEKPEGGGNTIDRDEGSVFYIVCVQYRNYL